MRDAFAPAILCGCLLYCMIGYAAMDQGDKEKGPPQAPDIGARDAHQKRARKMHELSQKPYRPQWAPLPLLHGELNAVGYLHDLAKSDDAANRARSAFLLGRIRCPDSVPVLVDLLDDPNRDVRIHAGIAMASMADGRGVHACRAALNGEPAWMRYYAVIGLWRIAAQPGKAASFAQRTIDCADSYGSQLVQTAITGVRNTDYVPLPEVDSAPNGDEPAPSANEIFEQAANVFITESDWWWHKGNYDQCIRCSEPSIFLDPDYADTYGDVAWLEWSMGRNMEAIGTLHRGIEAAPKNPDAHFNLGQHYWNIGRHNLAENSLKRAVQLGGDHLARRLYAHALESLGKLQQALKQWEKLRDLRPKDGAVRLNYDRLKEKIEGE